MNSSKIHLISFLFAVFLLIGGLFILSNHKIEASLDGEPGVWSITGGDGTGCTQENLLGGFTGQNQERESIMEVCNTGGSGGSTPPTAPTPPIPEPPISVSPNSASGSVTVIVKPQVDICSNDSYGFENCSIKVGESSCLGYIQWRIDSCGNSTVLVSSPENKTISTAKEQIMKDIKIEYPSRPFYFYKNNQPLHSIKITASCVSGSTWSAAEKKCVSSTIPIGVEGELKISPSTCDIALGASTCTVTGATWTTKNTTNPNLQDGNVKTILSNLANNSTPLKVWVAYPQTIFNLNDGSVVLNTKTVKASCVSGSAWSATEKKCVKSTGQDLCPDTPGAQTTLPCPDNYCPPPTTQTTNTECSLRDGTRATSGSVTMIQTKIPSTCTFGDPVLLSDNCVYPCLPGSFWNPTAKECRNSVISFFARDCNIKLGENNCLSSVDWSISINKKFDITTRENLLIANQTNPIGETSFKIEYPSRNFYLYEEGNMEPLAVRTANATCEDGTKWSVGGNKCIKSTTVECDNGATNPPLCKNECPAEMSWNATLNKCEGVAVGNLNITFSTCDIALGASTCTVTGATWTTKNTTNPNLQDGNTKDTLSRLSNNSTPLKVWVAYPQTIFNLNDGSVVLNTKTVKASCVSGSTWSTTENKCVTDTTVECDNGATNPPLCKNECSVGMSWSVPQSKCIPECKDSWCKVLSHSANDCKIELGKSSCISEIEWSTEYITGSFAITTPNYITISNELFGKRNYQIEYPYRDFFFYNNGEELVGGNFRVNAICKYGTEWNSSEKKCVASDGEGEDDGDGGGSGWDSVNEVCGECNGLTQICTVNCLGDLNDCPGSNGNRTMTYPKTCTLNGGGNGELNPSIIINLKADPSKMLKGRTSSLIWETIGAKECEAVTETGFGYFNAGTDKPTKGSVSIKPTANTIYKIRCSDINSYNEATAEIKVYNINIKEI